MFGIPLTELGYQKMGYLFSDNGRDWEGDHPNEEINLLVEGAAYGWPDDDPDNAVPLGTLGPVAEWTPHTSLNGMDLRPQSSPLPGLNESQGFTLYATVYGSWNTLRQWPWKSSVLISRPPARTAVCQVNSGTVKSPGLQLIWVRHYRSGLDLMALLLRYFW